MGRFEQYTAAERRQMDKDQQDPRWLAWLTRMNEQLDRFLNETFPDMPNNPWTVEGLRQAEQAALERFPTDEAVALPENIDVADQFYRFFGEVFRRNFEGEWYNVPDFDTETRALGFGPVVSRPFNENYLDVVPLLTTAVYRREGDLFASIFGYSQEDYAEWQAAGRLPLKEWIEIRDKD
ncbi:hypothetical protein [Nocardia pseudovaccinii]|uniref:hypothetical protein n=1 Tax=Nocardia pseudovaccinii TaxID=189540 RepID=UPI0007A45651|nr:hypothetical protein [Nocardia pseudovaccinii]